MKSHSQVRMTVLCATIALAISSIGSALAAPKPLPLNSPSWGNPQDGKTSQSSVHKATDNRSTKPAAPGPGDNKKSGKPPKTPNPPHDSNMDDPGSNMDTDAAGGDAGPASNMEEYAAEYGTEEPTDSEYSNLPPDNVPGGPPPTSGGQTSNKTNQGHRPTDGPAAPNRDLNSPDTMGKTGAEPTGGKTGGKKADNSTKAGKSDKNADNKSGNKSGNKSNNKGGNKSGNKSGKTAGNKGGNSGKSGSKNGNNGNNGNNGKNGGKPGRNNNGPGAYDYLTKQDERMAPRDPPGAPQIPSKCMEDPDCAPCFEEAQASLDKQRRNLEKVRGIYDYTHRFTKRGQEFMSAAGQAGGGISQMGAVAENMKVDSALEDFDSSVRNKNEELLGVLKGSLEEIAQCEAEHFNNDDWYVRYGAMYYQFMLGHYSYAQAPGE